MPSLYSLRQDFHKLNPEKKLTFLEAYRQRRAIDLQKPSTYGVNKAKKIEEDIQIQAIGITPEELALAKTLGLTKKDLLKLKNIAATQA